MFNKEFSRDFIKAVANGERLDEVKKLSPVQSMQLGLAVRQLEEEQGVFRDKVQYDDATITKFIKDRNK
jgi:hypothetical protein